MKHKKIAVSTALLAALLALTLVLLTGCSQAVYATVSPAWQTNTEYDEDFAETLTYSLSYTSSYEANDTGWRVSIDQDNSYYTVTVTAEQSYATEDGTRHWNVYHLHSELVIAATYSYFYSDGTQREIVSFGGDSGTEPDRIVTDVWFHSLAAPSSNESQHSLEPIYSERTVLSHTPTSMTSDNVSWFSYTSAISYDAAGENATLTFTDNWGELSEEDRTVSDYVYKYSITSEPSELSELSEEDRTVSDYVYKYSITSEPSELSGLRNSYSAFDNEQLIFIARGLSYSASSSESIVVLSETAGAQTVAVACQDRADTSCSFLLSSTNASTGTTTVTRLSGTDIYAAQVSFSLTNAGYASGAARTVYYAQESGYYNAPLRMEIPFTYSAGTITYTLTSLAHTE